MRFTIIFSIMSQAVSIEQVIEKQAAVYFARIYCNSIDRRSGASCSFHFSSKGSIAQNEFVTTAQDSINFILLQSIEGIGNRIENARLVINKDPSHPYSKFITLRAIRKMDRHIWDDYIGIWSDKTLPKISQEQRNSIKKLMSSTYNASQMTKSEDRYFWLFTTSYLAFINRDFDYSKKLMAQIPSEIYTEDVSILTILCEVFSWNMINSEEEDYLFSIKFDDQLRKYKSGEPLNKLINHHVSHLYYIQGDLAKSFLVMNNLKNLKKYKSFKLCQNLLDFISKENKTDYEQYLLDRSEKESFRFTEFENYISNQIVLYYLIRQDPESAQKWLNEDSYYFNIPNNIFSNQILDIVNPRYAVFSDSTHEKSPFLINQDLNLATLTETLVNLLSYTKSNKSKIRSEAYYLLGNFYYNICNTSHFRGLLLDTSYLSYLETPQSFWLYRKKTTSVEQIDNNKGYNISSSRYRFKRYWKYADTAFEYFQKAIDNSTDREFQTKCLYMMAKCEQNSLINNLRSYKYREYYKGQLDEKTIPYKKSFKKIRDDYSDTEYYDLLIEECSFFKHYCTQTKY